MIRLNKAKFYLSFILIQLFIVGCLNTSQNDSNEIHISGQIINPVLDIIKFESTDSTFTAKLTKDGNFKFSFPNFIFKFQFKLKFAHPNVGSIRLSDLNRLRFVLL